LRVVAAVSLVDIGPLDRTAGLVADARRTNSIHDAAIADGEFAVLGPLMNKNRAWTAEEDRRLLELRAIGRSSISIGVALRRSAKAVDGRLRELRKRDRNVETDVGQ
jgi:hypothetical protein